jgi:hypothetical protein
VNLKADVIKYLMKDFTNLRELTLSFAKTEGDIGGLSKYATKRKDIGALITAIMDTWNALEYLCLERFQFNTASAASTSETQLYDKLNNSNIRHIVANDCYLYSTSMFFAGSGIGGVKPKSMQNVMQRNGEIMSMFAGL